MLKEADSKFKVEHTSVKNLNRTISKLMGTDASYSIFSQIFRTRYNNNNNNNNYWLKEINLLLYIGIVNY